jgi:hypothetical protein
MRVAIRIALGLAVLFFFVETRAGTIYRCELDGAVTFSDRPCGSDAKKYEPDASRVSEFKPVPARFASSVHTKSPPRQRRTEPGIAAAQAKHAEECRRIHDSLRAIRAKMRAGYTAKEGERLKERQQKLNVSRRMKHC